MSRYSTQYLVVLLLPEFLQQCGVAWIRSVWHCSGVVRAQVSLLIQSTRIWHNNLIDIDFGESFCTRHFLCCCMIFASVLISVDVPLVYMLPLLYVLCPFCVIL